jgi:hypothetical protein
MANKDKDKDKDKSVPSFKGLVSNVASYHKDDPITAGVIVSRIRKNSKFSVFKWYMAIHRFSSNNIYSRIVLVKANDVDFDKCMLKLWLVWLEVRDQPLIEVDVDNVSSH